jgi:MSHA biogenesis protein MshQ
VTGVQTCALPICADTGSFRLWENKALPTGDKISYGSCVASSPARLMLPYWTDLNPNGQSGGGSVTWQQKGSVPNRYLVVSWNNVYQYNTSTPYTFQVILYESGEFKYQYGSGNASGSNGTIGVQVSSSDYTQYAYNSGYNANGSAIRWFIPSGAPTRLAEYRFDEFSLNGTVGEVVDSTGNGHNGVRANAAVNTTAAGKVCRALNIPNDQSDTSVAVDTAIDVKSAVGNAGTVSMWFKSNVAWSTEAKAMLFDATMADKGGFFLMRNAGGSLSLVVADSAETTLKATTAAQTYTSADWVHIAATWSLRNGNNQSTLRI